MPGITGYFLVSSLVTLKIWSKSAKHLNFASSFFNVSMLFGKNPYQSGQAVFNPIALRMAKIVCNFGHSECNMGFQPKVSSMVFSIMDQHTCDKLQRGIREVFLSFPGGF